MRTLLMGGCALGVLGLLGAAPLARAQCDDDGGADVCDDAGQDETDAGFEQPAADAGRDAAAPGESVACSCDVRANENGAIHTCTGSIDAAACASLMCELGTVRRVGCEVTGVELCCEMPSRALYANLYDDCTHPNCEAGFRAQCRDFDGTIHSGLCEAQRVMKAKKDDDDGGFCSVGRVGGAGSAGGAPWALAIAGVGLLARRRRSHA